MRCRDYHHQMAVAYLCILCVRETDYAQNDEDSHLCLRLVYLSTAEGREGSKRRYQQTKESKPHQLTSNRSYEEDTWLLFYFWEKFRKGKFAMTENYTGARGLGKEISMSELYHYRFDEKLTNRQIADRLGVSYASVYALLGRQSDRTYNKKQKKSIFE